MDWTTLTSTFGLLFIAELGDKTQLAVITQVCKYRRPRQVFLGGALALALLTGLGVAFGRALSTLVPALLMQRIAAAAFVVMGMLIFVDVIRSRRNGAQAQACDSDVSCEGPKESRRLDRLAFTSTFGLLFAAELGDKTQLAALSMASKSASPWPVFIGAAAALTLVTGLGVLFGQGLARVLPERVLKLVSAGAFLVLGVVIWLGIL